MAKTDLQKLNRAELLELLVMQTERADRLAEELKDAKEHIRSRQELLIQATKLEEAANKILQALNRDPYDAQAQAQAQQRQKAQAQAQAQQRQKAQAQATAQQRQKAQAQAAAQQRQRAQAQAAAQQRQRAQAHSQTQAGSASWSEIIKSMKQEQAPKAAPANKNGIDVSAIMAITNGIGKF